MKTHRLKTIPPFFMDLWLGKKTFEIRSNDRAFVVGDELLLDEYFPSSEQFGQRRVIAEVTHVMDSQSFPDGLKDGYVCMSVNIKDRIHLEVQ